MKKLYRMFSPSTTVEEEQETVVTHQLSAIHSSIGTPLSALLLFSLLQSYESRGLSPFLVSDCDATAIVLSKVNSTVFHDKMNGRLKLFSNLQSGWNNDPDSHPIHLRAIEAVKQLIASLSEDDLKGWSIYPDPIGAVLLDYNSPVVSITMSIGHDGYSILKYGQGVFVTANYDDLDISRMSAFIKSLIVS